MAQTGRVRSRQADAHGQFGHNAYDRLRDLPRLLRLWPEEVLRLGNGEQAWLVAKLRDILRAERQRGIARHWSYDISRHAALLRAYRAEDVVLRKQTLHQRGAPNKKTESKPLGPAPS